MSSSTQTRRHLSSKRDHRSGRILNKNLNSIKLNMPQIKKIEIEQPSEDTLDKLKKVVSR